MAHLTHRAIRTPEAIPFLRHKGVRLPGTGIVHQDLDRTELLLGEVEQAGRHSRLTQVSLHCGDLPTASRNISDHHVSICTACLAIRRRVVLAAEIGRGHPQVGSHNTHAMAGKPTRDRRTDAVIRSCDKRAPAGEFWVSHAPMLENA